MKNKYFRLSAVALVAAVMAWSVSCKDDKEDPSLSVSPADRSIVFTQNGSSTTSGATSFTVTTNQKAWDAVPDQASTSWLTVDKSATGFTLSASENSAPAQREATVTVTAGAATAVTIQVAQPGLAPSLIVTPQEVRFITFSPDGTSATVDGADFTPPEFTVTHNQSGWDAVSDEDWLTVDKSETGFTLTAAENRDFFREATVTVTAGAATAITILVEQDKIDEGPYGMYTWTVHSYSSEWGGMLVENTFDNDIETNWHTDTEDVLPQWYVVDMQKEREFNGFKFHQRITQNGAEPKKIRLEISNDADDDSSWTTVLEVDNIPANTENPAWIEWALHSTVKARYFKCTVLANQWDVPPYTSFAELQIYLGQEDPIGMHTWSVHSYSSSWNEHVPGRTFDNSLETMWHSYPWDDGTYDEFGMPQWYIVDMMMERNINGFKFHHRTDVGGLADPPTKITLEVSNDASSWTTVLEVEDIPIELGWMEWPLDSPVTARYFRCTVLETDLGGDFMGFAELQIY